MISCFLRRFWILPFFLFLFLNVTDSYAMPAVGGDPCGPDVLEFNVDLRNNPDSVWSVEGVVRNDQCCGAPTNEHCAKFVLNLNEAADGIVFEVWEGATPQILTWQLQDPVTQVCGESHQCQELVCLDGTGPYWIVFCKQGKNPNSFRITSIQDTEVSSDIAVSEGCIDTLTATGFDVSTIQWYSISPGDSAYYNSALSCDENCDITVVTGNDTLPDQIQYVVTGFPNAGCTSQRMYDTATVYFIRTIAVDINPQDPAICDGGTSVLLTANGSGGAEPYSYIWSTAASAEAGTGQTILAGTAEQYWVKVMDSTECGSAYDTVTVVRFDSPISVSITGDATVCSDESVTLDGTVVMAGGGMWSGGNGEFIPDDQTIDVEYVPTGAEAASGSLTLTLTSTDNRGCPPDDADFTITFDQMAIAYAGENATICANETHIIDGYISGVASSCTWTSSGTGTFNPSDNPDTEYTPSQEDKDAGIVTLTITTDDPDGPCGSADHSIDLTITPLDDPSFSYDANTYCISGADPVPVVTGDPGGAFAEATGNVSINAVTGAIDVSASNAGGPYNVTYTTIGPCIQTAVYQITIAPNDDPSFSYATNTYCAGDSDPTPIITGDVGGVFSEASGDISINPATGIIDISASVVGGPYTVTYTTAGPCTQSQNFNITILVEDDPSFNYAANTYCQGDVDPLPTITGDAGGSFSEATGNLVINAVTGLIDVSASVAGGPYIVTYTTTDPCSNSSTFSITIMAEEDPSFAYSAASYCQEDADPSAIISGTPGGTFTKPAGVVWTAAATGTVDLSASTTGGPYMITYTTPGFCSNSSSQNISILAEEDPSFSYSAASYCQGGADPSATIDGTGGGNFTAPAGIVWVDQASGEIDLSASTAGGPYNITYTTPGFCSNSDIVAISIIAEDDPSFTYSSNTFCKGDTDPTATITGTNGGSFSAPAQVVILNASTGLIDLSASTAGGPYVVTYTTAGTCPHSSNFNMSFVAEDDPSFSYSAATYCQGDADPTATITGTGGGTFTGPGQLIISNPGTGLIDLSASTAGGPYAVTYTTSGVCPNASSVNLNVLPEDDPSFTYSSNSFCFDDTDPLPTITGSLGGVFSEATGDLSFNAVTGLIDISASAIGGPYTVTYTTPEPCSNSTTFDVTILEEEDPSFSYSAISYCQGDADPSAIIAGTGGGVFTAPAQVSINPATGLIDLSASTAGGPYTITYTTGGTCSNATTFALSIVAEDDPSFNYSSNTYCQGSSDPAATITGTVGGTFTAPAQVSINPVSGLIDLSASTAGGPYIITYTTSGTCPNSSTFSVSIVAEDVPTFTYATNTYCQGDVDPTATITGTGGGTFTGPGQLIISNPETGLIDLSASTVGGPYTITYTTSGTCPNSSTFNLRILEEGDPSFTYSAVSYCQGDSDPLATITGTSGGVFSGPAEVVFLNTATGLIDLSASTVGGPYAVSYATPGLCTNSGTFNISIVEEDDASFSYPSNTYCQGDADPSATITGTGGGIFTAPAEVSINAGTGLIDLSASTAGGPYTITYTTQGTCPNVSTFNISIVIEDDPSFAYGSNTYCQGAADPLPVITGDPGGSFSEAGGNLAINAATGLIDLSASTIGGPYTVTYTTLEPCSNSQTFQITVVEEDDPSFSYTSASYCQSGVDPTAIISGTGGGAFSGPVDIVFLDAGTGEIDVSASTLGGPYAVTYLTTGTCPNSETVDITITDAPDATFSYAAPFCEQGVNPLPTFPGGSSAGTFSSSPAGLSFVNVNTGRIDLAVTTAGTYDITNTIAASGGCAMATHTEQVLINAIDNASFNYSAASYCQNDLDPAATITGVGGGAFTESSGDVSINASDGTIDLSLSTIGGPYTITYTTTGICPNNSTQDVTVMEEESPAFSYAASYYCKADSDPTPVVTGVTGGTFSAPVGISINAATGVIDLSACTSGSYQITYSTPGVCSNSLNFALDILDEENPAFTYASNSYCQGGTDPLATITGTIGGTFSVDPGLVLLDANTGKLDLSACTEGGPYQVIYTTPGTCSNSTFFNISIILDDPTYHYSAASYCQGDTDPVAIIDGMAGGSFIDLSGNLIVNVSSGQIDLSASMAGGPYSVKYTTSGQCPEGYVQDVTIMAEEIPDFSYSAASYCQGGADPAAVITGTGGGAFSAPAGVIWADQPGGEIDLSASTAGGPYAITYTTPGTCSNSTMRNVTIIAEDIAQFSYTDSTYCQMAADPTPTVTGTTGGTFTAVAGISINSASGKIDLSACTIGGPYVVTYVTPGTCKDTANYNIYIVGEDNPSFSYSANSYCQGLADPTPTITGTPGGYFSGPVSITFIDSLTGQIDLSASTAGGPYTIDYQTTGSCANTGSYNVLIVAEDIPAFQYDTSLYCMGDANPTPIITGTLNGVFSEGTGSVSLNASSGKITLASSIPGSDYYITYTTTGTCPNEDSVLIGIYEEGDPLFVFDTNVYCKTGADPIPNVSGTIGGTFSELTGNLSIDPVSGQIDVSASQVGNYSVTYTTPGNCQNELTLALSIVDGPNGNFSYNSPFCQFGSNPLPVMQAGAVKGTFSASSGDLTFVSIATGRINLTASLPGTYTIYNTIAASGGCSEVVDSATVTIYEKPTVEAGPNDTVCAGNNYSLNGSFGGGASSVTWSGTPGGVFSDSTIVNPFFTPSQGDVENNIAVLTIQSDDPDGPCIAAYDFVELFIPDAVYVNIDDDARTVCSNNPDISIDGDVSGASTTGVWTTSGNGTISPSDTSMSITYTLSPQDTTAGSVTLWLTSTNNGICNPVVDSIVLTILPSPHVNAGNDVTVCANNADISLNGVLSGSALSAFWTTSGDGTFEQDSSTMVNTYYPGVADTTAGSVKIYLESDNNGSCIAHQDSILLTITPAPYVYAGPDLSVCANNSDIPLNGTIYGGTATGRWETSGTGDFQPDELDLHAIYSPSDEDTLAGGLEFILYSTNNGNCMVVSDTMVVSIGDDIIVNAGENILTCANEGVVSIEGSIYGSSTTGVWSTLGTGTFTDSSSLFTTYYLSAADTLADNVMLILTSTNNGSCIPVHDTVTIEVVKPGVYVDAGSGYIACKNNAVFDIAGNVSGQTNTGYWHSSGTGLFVPDSSSLTAQYIASNADTGSSQVTLYLTSTNNGVCYSVTDSTILDFTPAPQVNAGDDKYVCVNNAVVMLTMDIGGGASDGRWSTLGSGIFLPNDSAMIVTYDPSEADTLSGQVSILLTSTDNGNCNPETDTVVVYFTAAPEVNAGEDQTVCASNPVLLTGEVLYGAGTGRWTSSGTGTFQPNETDLNAVYLFSSEDTTAHTVTLVLESTNAEGCNVETDTMIVTINSAPIVDAGPETEFVCANNSTLDLTGQITGFTTTGVWSTSGTGLFVPSDTVMSASYLPSAEDTLAGSITLYLTSTNNNDCNPVVDSIDLTITPSPIADAGSDLVVCKGKNAQLLGSITGGSSTGLWTTAGDGSFTPSDTAMNVIYHPGTNDTINGFVTIFFEATNIGNCSPSVDSILMTFTDLPYVDAGSDLSICRNNLVIDLAGSVSGGTTTGMWTTSGSGSFIPDNTSLTASYVPSEEDTTSGFVILTLRSTNSCLVKDSISVTFTESPTVFAGVDQNVCVDNERVDISGFVGGSASMGQWSSSGTGYFDDVNSLNTFYIRSSSDSLQGNVYLTLTSTDNGNCLAVKDSLLVNISLVPEVNAGNDFVFCSNNADIQLNGSVIGGTVTGEWTTSGSGTFNPSSSDLHAMYIPSSADTAFGNVKIVLHSTGSCIEVTDTVRYFFTPAPYVSAGPNDTVCGNNSVVQLNGWVSAGSSSGKWTCSTGGTFNPTANNLNASFQPSQNAINNGFATLILISTNNGMCFSERDTLIVRITPSPVITVGDEQYLCKGENVDLLATLGGSAESMIWTTTGTGVFQPSDSVVNPVYYPSDYDTTMGAVYFIATTTNNGSCNAVSTNTLVTLTSPPNVDAGINVIACGNNAVVDLNANVSGSSNTGLWETSGSGSFTPNNSTIDATYIPSDADTAAGSVTLTLRATLACPAEDSVVIEYTKAPYVYAGEDIVICSEDLEVTLSGIVANQSTTGKWTTSGNGTFNPSDSVLNATYYPGPFDTIAGFTILTLTSTNNGDCFAVSDSIKISYVDKPIVYAGEDQIVCANSYVQLLGEITGGTGDVIWSSSGSGTFSPNATMLGTDYLFSSEDTTGVGLEIILSTPEYSGCHAAHDTMNVTITPAPHVMILEQPNVCANNSTVELNGIVWGSSSTGGWVTWGDGSFSPDTSTLSVQYMPGSADIDSGWVWIKFLSTNNGDCYPDYDLTLMTISPAPSVYAGPDKYYCYGDPISVTGSVQGASSTGRWITLGDGQILPNDTSLSISYLPGTQDSITGNIQLVLTSTNVGDCYPESDTVGIHITDPPSVEAGDDQIVCANNSEFTLDGSVSGTSTTGYWYTSGTGTFSPDSSSLQATYIPGEEDAENGTVVINLISTMACPVKDSFLLNITPAPVVNVGNDRIICEGTTQVNVLGTISGGASTGIWSTTGTGSFSPNDSSMSVTYLLSDQDTTDRFMTLVLTTTDHGNCLPVSNSINITITSVPVVYAGEDQTVCGNMAAQLSGQVIGGAGTGVWSTFGYGSFIPDDSLLVTDYRFGLIDTINGSVTLVLTSTNACVDISDTMEVEILPAPHVEGFILDEVCVNNAIASLNAEFWNAESIHWYTLGDGMFSPSADSINPSYFVGNDEADSARFTLVIETVGNGQCNAERDTIEVDMIPAPQVYAGADKVVCFEELGVQLSGSISGGATTGVWEVLDSDGNGVFMPNDSSLNVVYIPSIADTSQGIITFVLHSTNNGNCFEVTDTLVASWGDSPLVYAGEDIVVCQGSGNILLNADIDGAEDVGYWTTNGLGEFTPQDTAMLTYYSPSDEIGLVEMYFTSLRGCRPVTDTLNLTINPSPVASLESFAKCNDSVVYFNSLSEVVEGEIISWEWAFGDGLSGVDDITSHEYDTAGDYYVRHVAVSDLGCSDTIYSLVKLREMHADFGFTGNCVGSKALFNDSTIVLNDSIMSWSWNYGDGISDTLNNTEHIYLSGQEYDVTLEVVSYNGCADSISKIVELFPLPVPDFTMDPEQPVMMNDIQFTDNSLGATYWKWDFGTGSDSAITANPVFAYQEWGDYTIKLTVANEYLCYASDSLQLYVANLGPPAVPSAFSPNGDGFNDVLRVLGGPFEDLTLQIYNDWGKLIFESSVQENGWDGKYKGKDQPVGVYIYIVEGTTLEGLPFTKTGDVTIIR